MLSVNPFLISLLPSCFDTFQVFIFLLFFAVDILLSISCSFSPELFLKSFSYGGDRTLLQKSEPSAVFVQFSFNTISPKTHLSLYTLFSVLLAMLRYELTPQRQSDNVRTTWFILFLLSPLPSYHYLAFPVPSFNIVHCNVL